MLGDGGPTSPPNVVSVLVIVTTRFHVAETAPNHLRDAEHADVEELTRKTGNFKKCSMFVDIWSCTHRFHFSSGPGSASISAP
jgi:pyrimidine deaminase RibD-like protein